MQKRSNVFEDWIFCNVWTGWPVLGLWVSRNVPCSLKADRNWSQWKSQQPLCYTSWIFCYCLSMERGLSELYCSFATLEYDHLRAETADYQVNWLARKWGTKKAALQNPSLARSSLLYWWCNWGEEVARNWTLPKGCLSSSLIMYDRKHAPPLSRLEMMVIAKRLFFHCQALSIWYQWL